MPGGRPRGGRIHLDAPGQIKTNAQIQLERWTNQTIGDDCRDQLGILQWLAARHLISNAVQCLTCGQPATLYRARTCSDGYTWRCVPCLFHRTVRAGSFFQRSHLLLKSIILMMYCWAVDQLQTLISREAEVPEGHTLIDWSNFFRDEAAKYVDTCYPHFYKCG